MKTYAETQGKTPFNWYTELQKRIDTRRRDPDIRLEWMAQDWVTCACGRQCDVIPRDKDGSPLDSKLRSLGCYFYCDIRGRDWRTAQKTLSEIESRSAILIAEEQAKESK